MRDSAFIEVEFFLLMLFSIVLPVGMYGFMMWRRAISRKTVLLFGFMLVAKSGVTIFLLQRLAEMARASPSFLDNVIFASQFSVVLYFVPILFAGIGEYVVSSTDESPRGRRKAIRASIKNIEDRERRTCNPKVARLRSR